MSNDGLRGLTSKLRNLPPEDVSFVRAPVTGLAREGAQSVVYLNDLKSNLLWDALRRGTVGGYAEQHAADALGPVTR